MFNIYNESQNGPLVLWQNKYFRVIESLNEDCWLIQKNKIRNVNRFPWETIQSGKTRKELREAAQSVNVKISERQMRKLSREFERKGPEKRPAINAGNNDGLRIHNYCMREATIAYRLEKQENGLNYTTRDVYQLCKQLKIKVNTDPKLRKQILKKIYEREAAKLPTEEEIKRYQNHGIEREESRILTEESKNYLEAVDEFKKNYYSKMEKITGIKH